ncbi:MAG: MFS transporter [Saprospiraceae bacterium]|nr:MFS transporter [Saprospiraceae bacterium]
MPSIMKGRYWVALGMFLLALLLYVDRICISVAKDPIAGELDLSDKAMGWVLSAFALGYALLQVPSGMLADRFGPRKILTAIVSFWSALTALTGAAWNFTSLLVVRFLFGAGEAGAFPGMSRAIYSWIPLKERGAVLGINFSGSRLGAAFALPLVAWLIESYGWRSSFLILGAVGILWALVWWLTFRDSPEIHPGLSSDEKEDILAHRQRDETSGSITLTWGSLFQSKNMWAAIGQYFCSNFTFFFALTWLFPYLKSTYQLEAMEAGWYAVAPFVAGAAGNWFAGGWVDSIFRRGDWNGSRKWPAMVGFSLAAAGLIGSLFMDTPLGAIFFLSVAIFGADMTLPPSWALCVDIGKRNAGAVSGTMNMAGNLGSFLTALAFPYLTDWTGSEETFFYVAAALNLLAIWLWRQVKVDQGLRY